MSDGEQYALAPIFGPGHEAMTSYTPHAAYLGMRVVETGPRYAIIQLPFRKELIGDPRRGVVFGGAITTLIDHTSGLAVACALDELRAIATIDLRVDYLRAAEPGVDLFARSECYRTTRNVAFVRAVAYERNPEEAFASCLATFMLGANPTESPFTKFTKASPSGASGASPSGASGD